LPPRLLPRLLVLLLVLVAEVEMTASVKALNRTTMPDRCCHDINPGMQQQQQQQPQQRSPLFSSCTELLCSLCAFTSINRCIVHVGLFITTVRRHTKTSGQSNLTTGRIAAAYGRFSGTRQVALLCTTTCYF